VAAVVAAIVRAGCDRIIVAAIVSIIVATDCSSNYSRTITAPVTVVAVVVAVAVTIVVSNSQNISLPPFCMEASPEVLYMWTIGLRQCNSLLWQTGIQSGRELFMRGSILANNRSFIATFHDYYAMILAMMFVTILSCISHHNLMTLDDF